MNMNSINKLERHIGLVKGFIKKDKAAVQENPEDFLAKACLRSNEYELDELHKALKSAKDARFVDTRAKMKN